MEMKKVHLQNGETYGYREREGGNIPLLLIHGNMTSSKHWDVLMEALPDTYHIIAPDLRGFGESSYHKRITSLKDLADDVKLFVDEIGLDHFHLAGWSLGGGVAMQVAANHPEQVMSLILLASASTRGYPFFTLDQNGEMTKRLETIVEIEKDPVRTIPVTTAYRNGDKAFLREMWNMVIYTDNEPEEPRYDAYLSDMMTQRNLPDVYQALNVFNISDTHNGLVEGNGDVYNITAPTLILYGERDQVVIQSMTDELMDDFGGRAESAVLKNCGHSPLIDDLDQLVERMDGFLQRQIGKVERT